LSFGFIAARAFLSCSILSIRSCMAILYQASKLTVEMPSFLFTMITLENIELISLE
jgi:hypothetical protein